MHDLPPTMLLQQSNSRSISGEELEIMGKYAASRYLGGECNLTLAVVETVKKAGLSPEQVKRVAEFANTDAYLREFRKEGTANKVVEFVGGPADVSEILKDLNDGGGGTVFDNGSGDYNHAPTGDYSAVKVASAHYDDELEALFTSGQEAVLPYSNPLGEAIDAREKLAAAYDGVTHVLSGLELAYEDVGDRLFDAVKQASLSGEASLGQIVQAWGGVTEDPDLVKAAFSMLSGRLVDNGVFDTAGDIGDSLAKTASAGVVNPDHPIVVEFGGFCEILEKLADARVVHTDLAEKADNLGSFLGSAITKNAGAIKSMVGGARKVWKGTTGATKALGKEVGGGIGGTPGKVVEKAIQYAPHAGVALAANEVHDRTKYKPSVIAANNFIKSRFAPHSREYNLRQSQLMHEAGY